MKPTGIWCLWSSVPIPSIHLFLSTSLTPESILFNVVKKKKNKAKIGKDQEAKFGASSLSVCLLRDLWLIVWNPAGNFLSYFKSRNWNSLEKNQIMSFKIRFLLIYICQKFLYSGFSFCLLVCFCLFIWVFGSKERFSFFIENWFFFHTIYSDYGFPSFCSSQFLPIFPPLQIYSLFVSHEKRTGF